MTDPIRSLADIRNQIDGIDDALLRLLDERAGLADAVRVAKGSGATIWRPAREAQVIRRLVAKSGHFPTASVVRIWREIVMALVMLEGGYRIALVETDTDMAVAARGHFGALPAFETYASAASVAAAVESDAGIIGVIAADDPFWITAPGDAPPAIARLPFLDDGSRAGLALAQIKPEDSGDDRTLLMLQTETHDPKLEALLAHGVSARSMGLLRSAGVLVEVPGFFAPDDPQLAELATTLGADGDGLIWRGAYATPLSEAGAESISPADTSQV